MQIFRHFDAHSMIETEAFDRYAHEYDMWFEDHASEYALELRAIRELLPKEGVGIEIGAGTGRFTRPLGIELGVEPSAAMRAIAVERGANIIAGTAEALPVDNDSYDFALLVTTVCFLEKPEIAFKEVYRVLRTAGYIIIGLIDKDSKLGRKYEEKKSESKFYKNAKFHSVVDIQQQLENTGFGHIEYVQAILPGDNNDPHGQKIKRGFGEGSFVVLRAQKAGMGTIPGL